MWGGGGGPSRLPSAARTSQARRKHGASTRRGTCPSAGGGGGLAVCHPSSPLLPCVRTPGGAEVCGGGGLSSSLRCTRVAGTTQARRKHGVRHLAAAGGGGVSPLGLPALQHGIGSAPQDLQPLLPLGGSRHVSAWCSVSHACSLLCPYLLEEVRTRVETDDVEVRATGRTYRTPRRLHAPSAALVEGGAPVSAPNSPGGGATAHPLPGACVSTSERPDTGAVVSVRWKWRLQSGRALSSPGPLPPPSAMDAPEVLWQRRGETGGGFICGIPWPPS